MIVRRAFDTPDTGRARRGTLTGTSELATWTPGKASGEILSPYDHPTCICQFPAAVARD